MTPDEIRLLLTEILEEGPEVELPYDFAAKLNRRIRKSADHRVGVQWYGVAALIAALGLGSVYVLLSFYDHNAAMQFMHVLGGYKWALLFIFFSFFTANFFDWDRIGGEAQAKNSIRQINP